MLPGEPRWLPTDRAKMIAYSLEKGEQCQLCGTSHWEWEADPEAYSAVLEGCSGCAVKDVFREQMGDATSAPGASVGLIPHAVKKKSEGLPKRRPISPREKAGKRTGGRKAL